MTLTSNTKYKFRGSQNTLRFSDSPDREDTQNSLTAVILVVTVCYRKRIQVKICQGNKHRGGVWEKHLLVYKHGLSPTTKFV